MRHFNGPSVSLQLTSWKPGSMVSRLIPGLLDVAQDHAKSAKRLLGAVNQDHVLPRAFLATHLNL